MHNTINKPFVVIVIAVLFYILASAGYQAIVNADQPDVLGAGIVTSSGNRILFLDAISGYVPD